MTAEPSGLHEQVADLLRHALPARWTPEQIADAVMTLDGVREGVGPTGDVREQVGRTLEASSVAVHGLVSRALTADLGVIADAVLALPAVREALDAQEVVTAVRELHARDATEPHACDYCGQAWPCDVIHALDTRGEPS